VAVLAIRAIAAREHLPVRRDPRGDVGLGAAGHDPVVCKNEQQPMSERGGAPREGATSKSKTLVKPNRRPSIPKRAGTNLDEDSDNRSQWQSKCQFPTLQRLHERGPRAASRVPDSQLAVVVLADHVALARGCEQERKPREVKTHSAHEKLTPVSELR
jgi:hypothetical protein